MPYFERKSYAEAIAYPVPAAAEEIAAAALSHRADITWSVKAISTRRRGGAETARSRQGEVFSAFAPPLRASAFHAQPRAQLLTGLVGGLTRPVSWAIG